MRKSLRVTGNAQGVQAETRVAVGQRRQSALARHPWPLLLLVCSEGTVPGGPETISTLLHKQAVSDAASRVAFYIWSRVPQNPNFETRNLPLRIIK